MSIIASVHGVVGHHRYPQTEITELFSTIASPSGKHKEVIDRIHQATGVKFRGLALPIEEYPKLLDFKAANDKFIEIALKLSADAINIALETAGVKAEEIDYVVSTSITGIATPRLEAVRSAIVKPTRPAPIMIRSGLIRLFISSIRMERLFAY